MQKYILLFFCTAFLFACMPDDPTPSPSPDPSPMASPTPTPSAEPTPSPGGEEVLSLGPNSAGTCVDNAGVGSLAWLDDSLTSLEGDEVASAGGDAAKASNTAGTYHYLVCTNLGFSVPPNAVIQGILVESRIQEDVISNDTFDHRVRIVKGGSIQSTDKSNVSEWPTALTYRSYGGPTDLWGTTWTPPDINASNFGYAHSITTLGGGTFSGRIDHVRITVYYDLPGDLGATF